MSHSENKLLHTYKLFEPWPVHLIVFLDKIFHSHGATLLLDV